MRIPLALVLCIASACLINPHEKEDFRDFNFEGISLEDNLVYYHFNESSYTGLTGDVIDSAPNNRNSDSVGDLNKTQGIFGEGINCDGTSGIDITPSIFDNSFSERTISVWFRANRIDGIHYIYEEGGTVNGINIYIQNGRLYGGTYKASGTDYAIFPSVQVQTDTWYHVAITYHDTDGFNFYVNGALVDGPIPTNHIFPSHGDPNGICFQNRGSYRHTGASNSGGQANYFEGVVDELGVWNRLLTNKELRLLYLRQGRL